MNLRTILIAAALAAAVPMPLWGQQSPGPGGTVDAQAEATFDALAPLVAPRIGDLSAAGVQKVVARTGKNKRDIQVFTQWGSVYFAWPKGVTPVAFEIYVEAPDAFDVTAAGYSEATKAHYASAFDAVLPLAIRSANTARAQAQRPKR